MRSKNEITLRIIKLIYLFTYLFVPSIPSLNLFLMYHLGSIDSTFNCLHDVVMFYSTSFSFN